jgi:NTP pyrophosphatase (non-canonical NTP hydrolase)
VSFYEEPLHDEGGGELINLAQKRTTQFLVPRTIQISNPTGRDPFFKGQPVNANHINPVMAANILLEACHGAAKAAGWWINPKTGESITGNPYCFSNKLMLTVSELSEAMEGDRKNLMDDKLTHRPMREVELADAVIRIFDLAGAYNMDLGGAIAEKLAFNAQRPDHKLENRQADGGKAY